MLLQYFFGKLTDDQLQQEEHDLDNLFEDENGNYYFFQLVAHEEEFYIQDTCGRLMPFDATQVGELGLAIYAAASVYSAADEASDLFDQRMVELDQTLAFAEFAQ